MSLFVLEEVTLADSAGVSSRLRCASEVSTTILSQCRYQTRILNFVDLVIKNNWHITNLIFDSNFRIPKFPSCYHGRHK